MERADSLRASGGAVEWARGKHGGLGHELFLMRMTHKIRDPTSDRRSGRDGSGRDTGKSNVPCPMSKVRKGQQTNRVPVRTLWDGTWGSPPKSKSGARNPDFGLWTAGLWTSTGTGHERTTRFTTTAPSHQREHERGVFKVRSGHFLNWTGHGDRERARRHSEMA